MPACKTKRFTAQILFFAVRQFRGNYMARSSLAEAFSDHFDRAKPTSQGSRCVNDPTPSRLKTILLVDNGNESRLVTKWFLSYFGYVVDSVRSAEEALRVFDPRIHDAVLTDNSMEVMSGLEMAHIIKLRSPSTPVIMHSGLPPEDRSCLDLVVQKPAHVLDIKEALDKLLAGTPSPK
jgi:CheY-like chemotaxis protein